jgi:hypothetical protein
VLSAWREDALRRIGEAQELEIAPVRRNGELRRRTPIWVVRAGEAVLDQVDAGYRSKYGRYASIVDSINDADHRATTLRLVPRDQRRET